MPKALLRKCSTEKTNNSLHMKQILEYYFNKLIFFYKCYENMHSLSFNILLQPTYGVLIFACYFPTFIRIVCFGNENIYNSIFS